MLGVPLSIYGVQMIVGYRIGVSGTRHGPVPSLAEIHAFIMSIMTTTRTEAFTGFFASKYVCLTILQ